MTNFDTSLARSIYFDETSTSLVAGDSFVGPARDSGSAPGNLNEWSYYIARFSSDQSGDAYIEASKNGTDGWYVIGTVAVTASSTPFVLSSPIMARYHRVRYVNGSTDQGSFYVHDSYSESPYTTASAGGGGSGTITNLPALGPADASGSLPVVLANDDVGVAKLTSIATDIHNLATDVTPVYTVGLVKVQTASFTRPANTTIYTVGNLVANSTVAGSVTPMNFTGGSVNGSSGMVRKARIRKSGTAVQSANFRLHIWNVAPTVTSAVDNGALTLIAGVAGYQGSIDIVVDRAFSDGAVGSGMPHTGSEINYTLAAGDTKLYALLEASTAYTPASGELFTIDLEILPNS